MVIVAVAFALRLSWVMTVHAPVGGLADDAWYYATAANIAAGRGLTVTAAPGVGYIPGEGGYQTLFWPPGYSLTLGGTFAIFGSDLATARALNVVAGTLAVAVTYGIGARVFGRPAGLVAAALLAVYPASIAWTTVTVSETLFTVPFSIAVFLLVVSGGAPNARLAAGFGFALGYAAIIRPQAAVIWLAAFVFWWVWYNRTAALRLGAIAGVGLLAWVVPISIWNSARSGAPQTVSTNAAFNLRIGHSPDANGLYRQPRDPRDTAVLTSPDYDAQGRHAREAIRYATTHPVREIELSARKVWGLYAGDTSWVNWTTAGRTQPIWGSERTTQALTNISNGANAVLLLSIAAGAPWSFARRDQRLALWLVMASWTGVHIVFFSDARFHLPVLPIMMPMAAVGLLHLWRSIAPASNAPAA